MLVKLSLSPQAHILFVHLTTNVEIYLVTEKIEDQEIRMAFYSLIVVFPKGKSLKFIYIGLKL